MRGLSWAVVLVAALAGQAGAQTVASGTLVTPTVQDQTGAVLPGAIVDLVSSAGTIAQTVQADAGGSFRFDNVRAGQYELRARFEGFKSASSRLRVAARAPGPQRLVLGLANLRQEITVSNVPTQVDAAAGNNVDAVPYTEMLGQDLYNNGRGRARPAGVPRNSLMGDGYRALDLRVPRDVTFATGEQARSITIALDAFNVFNHVNYGSYVGTLSSPLFGRPVTARAARQLQLSARMKF